MNALAMERALRRYAGFGSFEGRTLGQLQRDLLAIAGDPHIHDGRMIGDDECFLCGRDLRADVHLRESTTEEARR